jgi:hypothetical protein
MIASAIAQSTTGNPKMTAYQRHSAHDPRDQLPHELI